MTDRLTGGIVTSSEVTAVKRLSKVAKPKPAAAKIVGSLKKSSGTPKSTKGQSLKHHPKYIDMVLKAINELKERNGSSSQAIAKHIRGNFNLGPAGISKTAFRNAMKNGIAKKMIKSNGKGMLGKFKVNTDVAVKSKSKKPAKVVSKVISGFPSNVAKISKPKVGKSAKKVENMAGKKSSPVKKLTKRPATKPSKPMVIKKAAVTKKKVSAIKKTPTKKAVPKVVKK